MIRRTSFADGTLLESVQDEGALGRDSVKTPGITDGQARIVLHGIRPEWC
jgi:hypothetical protein